MQETTKATWPMGEDGAFDRQALVAGIDDAIESSYIEDFTPNATYSKAPSRKALFSLPIVQGFSFAIRENEPVSFDGDPGTGKTSFVDDLCEALGIELFVFNLAQMGLDNVVVPAPHDDPDTGYRVLDYKMLKELSSDSPKIIFLDDKSRAPGHVQSMALEIVQSRTIQGLPINGLVTVLGSDNDGKDAQLAREPDLAAKDRWTTFKVDSHGTPWRYALASKFSDTDLSGVFNVYKTLTPAQRRVLSPRKLEHVITALLEGVPGVWALSIIGGERVWIDDEDTSFEILGRMASALGVPMREKVADPVRVAYEMVKKLGINAYIESPPGSGKTSYVQALAKEDGFRLLSYSAPLTAPEDWVLPDLDKDGNLVRMPNGRLTQDPGVKRIALIDEIWRAPQATRNSMMPVLQERRVGGVPLNDLVGVIACNNPKEVCGRRLDVGRPDPAQADRFHISLQITHDDIPGLQWLLSTYAEDAEPVVAWYQEDLPSTDPSRVLITRRTLERMIKLSRNNLPIENALITEKGERIPVDLSDLRARLSNRPLARLKAIAANVDDYVAKLSEKDNPEAQDTVYEAFSRAELSQLEEQREAIVRLIKVLEPQFKVNLVRHGGPKQAFWHSVLMEAVGKAA